MPVSATTAPARPGTGGGGRVPLWKQAQRRGIAYGSSTATWQIADEEYARLFGTERAVVRHDKGRVDAWSVANEVTSPEGVRGVRTDVPREDGAARRPLPFDEDLQPKPAYRALSHSLKNAPWRTPAWRLHREGSGH